MDELDGQILAQGTKIREMKAGKAEKSDLDKAVANLKDLKAQYKAAVGKDWQPPASANSSPPAPKKEKKEEKAPKKDEGKKEAKKDKKAAPVEVPVFKAPKATTFYPSFVDVEGNMKCWLAADALKVKMNTAEDGCVPPPVPRLPALSDKAGTVFRFGANAICMYLEEVGNGGNLSTPSDHFELEEDKLSASNAASKAQALLDDTEKACSSTTLTNTSIAVLYPRVKALVEAGGKPGVAVSTIISTAEALPSFKTISSRVRANLESLDGFDYKSAGLQTSLKLILSHAIASAFPATIPLKCYDAIVMRCNNPNFGDFQCNNSMEIAKKLKVNCGKSMINYDSFFLSLSLSTSPGPVEKQAMHGSDFK